jgi:hypothetical protein
MVVGLRSGDHGCLIAAYYLTPVRAKTHTQQLLAPGCSGEPPSSRRSADLRPPSAQRAVEG